MCVIWCVGRQGFPLRSVTRALEGDSRAEKEGAAERRTAGGGPFPCCPFALLDPKACPAQIVTAAQLFGFGYGASLSQEEGIGWVHPREAHGTGWDGTGRHGTAGGVYLIVCLLGALERRSSAWDGPPVVFVLVLFPLLFVCFVFPPPFYTWCF